MVQRANKWLGEQAAQWKQKSRTWVLPVAILCLVYLVALSALLRADVNYIDDMGRAAFGYRGWDNFSRFLSNFLAMIIHVGRKISDISPLTQIIAVIIMSLSGIIVLHLVTGEKKFSLWQYAAVVPMGLSPYFLECFSYKFDSPYMALSVLAGVAPLLLYRKGRLPYVLGSIAGIIVVCTTYQVSSGIFPMLVVFLALMMWHRGEEIKAIASFVGLSVLGYGIGLVIFRVFIMVPVTTYVSNEVPSLSQMIPNTLDNYKQYFQLIISDFRKEWLILVVILVVCFVYTQVWASCRNKVLAFFVTVVGVGISLLLCFGLYPLLVNPSFQPRGMYGFGMWIAFLGAFVAAHDKIYVGKLTCLALAWAFMVFGLVYGNAISAQNDYVEFRVEQTIDDLVDFHVLEGDKAKTVQIIGDIGDSVVVKNRPEDENILPRLIRITFGDSSWMWARYTFTNYYGLSEHIKWDSSVDLTSMDLPIIVDNLYHTIRANGEYVLIELKG